MTTKPKANKFRRRNPNPAHPNPVQGQAPQQPHPQQGGHQQGGFEMPVAGAGGQTPNVNAAQAQQIQQQRAQQQMMAQQQAAQQQMMQQQMMAQQGNVASAQQVNSENTIESIRREGLTGRQLRMARRAAQRHGIAATSDFDAVRQLRERGIDPFERANMLELVQGGAQKALAQVQPAQLPQTVPAGQNMPSTAVNPAAQRATEIHEIQRDIIKRRRSKMMLLLARLGFFVALPGLIATWYFYFIATPMYSVKSSFLIQQNDAQEVSSGGGLGGMMGGSSPMATVLDSINVQNYLTSLEALIRLDQELGYKEHFSDENIDILARLEENATNAAAFKVYAKNVKLGYDPTEGIINMEVIAATPEASVAFSEALIRYAEQQVSDITLRLREDQMQSAREYLAEAEAARDEALQLQVELQQRLGAVDPGTAMSTVLQLKGQLQAQLQEKELQLAQQLDNARPNQAKVEGLQGDIARLREAIAEKERELNEGSNGNESMASITAQLRVAEMKTQSRELILQGAFEALENARVSADRQTRYMGISVAPVLPDEPAYPRAFENSLLAFLIFGGIYLMMSLTASILREQV